LIDALVDIFYLKGVVGVNLAISSFFFLFYIPFDVAHSPWSNQMVFIIDDGFVGYTTNIYESVGLRGPNPSLELISQKNPYTTGPFGNSSRSVD